VWGRGGLARDNQATAACEDEQQAGDQSLVGVAVAVLPHDLHEQAVNSMPQCICLTLVDWNGHVNLSL